MSGSCADGTCDGETCLCAEWRRRFPPIVPCPQGVKQGVKEKPCRFIAGHDGPCQPARAPRKVERAELKDAEPRPDLSAPRAAAASLAFVKRRRVMDKARFGPR